MAAIQGQNTSSGTSAPIPNENGVEKFRVGLTRAEASSNETLNSLFNEYNKDGDNTISQAEFDTYLAKTANQQQQDITSASGKRVAVGGVYTIQAGDSLSKIAKDFGIPLLDLYNANVDVIGKSVNSTIYPGQQLKISKPQSSNESENVSPTDSASKAEKKQKMADMLAAYGIDVTNEDTQKLFAEFRKLSHEQKHEIMHKVMGQYIDFEKVNTDFTDKSLDEIVQMLNIDKEKWDAANAAEKGSMLAESMNAKFRADLDPENENSAYNKELQRLKTQGPTEREREMYGFDGSNFDFDNLSEEDYENLAKLSVAQGYVSTVITIAHEKFENNQDEDFSVLAQSYMRSIFKSEVDGGNDIENFLAFLGGTRKVTNDDIKSLLETYSEVHKSDGTEDSLLQKAAFHAVMENVDEEHIKMLYKNNANEIDALNDVARTVAANTTDESRKSMLNNIVANSAQIVQGNNSGSQNTSANRSVVGQPVSNPIQQNAVQISYVSDLRQASQAYQAQMTDDNNAIPEQYRQHFATIQEYRDFKGTGMTMAEYQRAKAFMKNNFTTAMNALVENYANIPDKFKPRILSFFDSMDNNTAGELYLNANDKVRTFMDKYNYMTNEKLLTYVEIHPACINDAPKGIQQMIRELQEEQPQQ